jgi:NADPH:quinone reductase-like Zn-dependent oxidoreductase
MIIGLINIPKFDPMDMVLTSKAVLGFNLSFFADEHDLIAAYMEQIVTWVETKQIVMPEVTVLNMEAIAQAHEFIQSGKSVGKIVMKTSTL